MTLDVRPLTADRWDDFVALAGGRGNSILRYCWCMHYRKTGARESVEGAKRAEGNKRAMKALVTSGTVPGLLAYRDGRPVGWISVGPRQEYPRLATSPIMRPVDDKPVWSIVCFFVDAHERGRGVAAALLRGAIEYAQAQGATLLEAYPVDRAGRSDPLSMWFGAKSMYDRAGFTEVARRKETRPVVRRRVRRRSRLNAPGGPDVPARARPG